MIDTCLIDRIVAPHSLSFLFQPIVHATGTSYELHAYEALTRGPAGTNVHAADVLFEYVRRKCEEVRVDRLCVAGALAEAAGFASDVRINLNVHASTLTRDPSFAAHVDASAMAAGVALDRVVIEIVEYAPGSTGPAFAAALADFRRRGCAIALDDVGLGNSNYRMILDSRPDYFKVDRFLVDGVSGDPYRLAIIRSIVSLADAVGATVVAEGVEAEQDVEALQSAGISLFQGYFFGRPQERTQIAIEERYR